MVTDTMCDEDMLALAEVLAERDEGFIQITQLTMDLVRDRAFSEKLAEVSGRPIIWNAVAPARSDPQPHREPLQWLDGCWERGLQLYAQCVVGRAGFAFTLENWNLYDASPAWNKATTGTKQEKIAKMSDPDLRKRLKAEFEEADKRLRALQQGLGGPITGLIIQDVAHIPELEHYVGMTIGQVAEAEGKHPIDAMLDLSIKGDLKVEFLGPEKGANAEFMAEMMARIYSLPGMSDGGAHTKFFTGGAWTTDMIKWLVRDEKTMSLEEAHYRMSALSAHAAGFRDRGMLREGMAADIIVYNLEELDVDPHWNGRPAYDLPGGEWRRVQRAKGYRSIIVNGTETFINGECTGATPGKFLRFGRG
jgi:N-acyl-D-aspartate/D-glutamate deacylase